MWIDHSRSRSDLTAPVTFRRWPVNSTGWFGSYHLHQIDWLCQNLLSLGSLAFLENALPVLVVLLATEDCGREGSVQPQRQIAEIPDKSPDPFPQRNWELVLEQLALLYRRTLHYEVVTCYLGYVFEPVPKEFFSAHPKGSDVLQRQRFACLKSVFDSVCTDVRIVFPDVDLLGDDIHQF